MYTVETFSELGHPCIVRMSFELSHLDWCRFEKSEIFRSLVSYLEGLQNKKGDERKMNEELLPIQKLETLSIDIANKKFLINGKDFGSRCKRLSIECVPPEWKIRVVIDKPAVFTFDLKGKRLK